MRKYETFFIIDPDLPDEGVAGVDEKLKKVVGDNRGTILGYTPWGKKKLAYPVNKRSRGNYILMEYAGGPELVAELERNMRLDERVLKFITVKLEDTFDPDKEPAEKPKKLSPFGETEETGEEGVRGAFEERDEFEEEGEEEFEGEFDEDEE